MAEKCYACDNPVSEKARFCGKCATQVRCKSCGEDLVEGAIVCEICGEDVVVRQTQSTPMNRVKFRDGRKDIEIEALFTNEVGESAATMFAMMRGVPAPPRLPSRPNKATSGQGEIFEPATVVNELPEFAAGPTAITSPLRGNSLLQSLFELRDEQWVLVNPNLKAKSKADYVKRATCLFLQFQFDNGVKLVPRGDVVKVLQNCSVYDTNARDWFAKEKSLLRATATDLSLLLPGHQYISEHLLPEIADDAVANAWKVGTVRKSPRKASSKKEESSALATLVEKPSNKSAKK